MSKEEWQEGWYADYFDASARQWTVIKILEIKRHEDEIFFEFDGWPKKWNSTCKISSRKLAPFRLKSVGYTGPKENSVREWTYKAEEIKELEITLRALINGNLSTGNAGKTSQLIRGYLFNMVDILLIYFYKKNEYMRSVQFFCTVIEYIVEWLKKGGELFSIYYDSISNPESFLNDDKVALAASWPELLITLKRIFGLDLRTSKFHNRSYPLTQKELKDYDSWHGSNIKANNFQSYFINYFGKKEGFDLIISLLSQKE